MLTRFYTRTGEKVFVAQRGIDLAMGTVIEVEKRRFTVVAARLRQLEEVIVYTLELIPGDVGAPVVIENEDGTK